MIIGDLAQETRRGIAEVPAFDALHLPAKPSSGSQERCASLSTVPMVVCTHHAPHKRSVAAQYDGDLLTAAFVSHISISGRFRSASGRTCWGVFYHPIVVPVAHRQARHFDVGSLRSSLPVDNGNNTSLWRMGREVIVCRPGQSNSPNVNLPSGESPRGDLRNDDSPFDDLHGVTPPAILSCGFVQSGRMADCRAAPNGVLPLVPIVRSIPVIHMRVAERSFPSSRVERLWVTEVGRWCCTVPRLPPTTCLEQTFAQR